MDSSVPTKLSETCLLIISVEALKWKEVGRQKEEDCSNGLDSRENSSVTFSLEKPKEGVGGSQGGCDLQSGTEIQRANSSEAVLGLRIRKDFLESCLSKGVSQFPQASRNWRLLTRTGVGVLVLRGGE